LIQTGLNSDANLGRIVLTKANTYSGGTIVRGGTMEVSGAPATFGAGDVFVRDPGTTLTNGAGISAAVARLLIPTGVANAIADTATLSIDGGFTDALTPASFVQLGAGINEVVARLTLGGNPVPKGTYGSTASTAKYKNDEYFAGTGILTVTDLIPEPASYVLFALGSLGIVGPRRRR
jgi:fibronectin-binding autotransporter adhesin